MKIELVQLVIENFKGIQKQVIVFDPVKTVIAGRNETGKTTVADAFFYVMFGKDSYFRTKFDIIPLDGDNNPIHHLETSVELDFKVDGQLNKIKRVLTENWTKKRGIGEEKELTGTSTSLFVNDSPVKTGEFNEFISGIISEDKFMLLTSATYFNVQMSWQERRKLLTSLIENIRYEDIVTKDCYGKIKDDILLSGIDKTLNAYKYQHKQIKKNVEDIPARIDEVSKNINRDSLLGVDELKANRDELKGKIDKLKKDANEKYISESDKMRAVISRLNTEISDIESSEIKKTHSVDNKTELYLKQRTLTHEIQTLNQEIYSINAKIDKLEADRTGLKEKYIELSAMNYEPGSNVCPTCKQELPENMKKEAEAQFVDTKTKQLANFQSSAGELKEAVTNQRNQLENKKTALDLKTKELDGVKHEIMAAEQIPDNQEENVTVNPLLARKKEQKEEYERNLRNIDPNPYKDKISDLETAIDIINNDLSGYEASEKAKKRVAELEKELESGNEELLEIESKLSLIDQLKLDYIDTVEGDINSLFDKKIKVRLFEKQVNGGFRETCDILVQNRQGALVPWNYVNTAGQINSSLQIINILSKHLDIYPPVFIDHTESVEELFKTEAQMVELKFLSSYQKLTVK